MSSKKTGRPEGILMVAFLLTGCGTEGTPANLDVGSLHVTTATTGEAIDDDGYALVFDNGTSLSLQATGTLRVLSVPAGERTLELQGVADNCDVDPVGPVVVTIATGDTASVAFSVTCFGPDGTVAVRVTTTGDSIDADGYVVALDGDSLTVAADDSVAFAGIRPGMHDVELLDVAPNCSVPDGTIVTVDVPSAGEVLALFAVVCTVPSSVPPGLASDRGAPLVPSSAASELVPWRKTPSS
jgi:hypothetical protein